MAFLRPRRLLLLPAEALPPAGVFGRDLNPEHYRQHLGSQREALHWDAGPGLRANALAALLPTVAAGGFCALHLPAGPDPDHERLADWGTDLGRCSPHFNQRLRRLAREFAVPPERSASLLELEASEEIIFSPDRSASLSATVKAPAHAERTAPLGSGPQILLGPRGSGKSTLLAAQLRALGPERVLLVTPFRPAEALRPFRTWPPDEALRRRPPADYLIIDEAASIAPAQLWALTRAYPNYVLASSVDGYEGQGRALALRLLPRLQAVDGAQLRHSVGSHRFSALDPLARFTEAAFLLNPDPGPAPKRFGGEALRFRLIGPAALRDEALLRRVYGLLHRAHYRTSPEDLKRLLDLPDQWLLLAEQGEALLGVLQLLLETPLPEDLARAVMAGSRRPRGRLFLQQLLGHSQDLRWNRPWLRVSRIAVRDGWRRQGLGRRLLHRAQELLPTPLAVSHQNDEALAGFWQALGFRRWPTASRTMLWLSSRVFPPEFPNPDRTI